MIGDLFKALAAGLSLWSDKEKNKYVDHLNDLKKAYYVEYNKPSGERDDAYLDDLEFELRLLTDSFCSQVGKQNS